MASKRVFDLTIAVLGLMVFSPLMAIIALLLKVAHGSPVLFRQIRPGLHGHPFQMIKFRTMIDERGLDNKPLPDEERLTRLGKVLRSTSLDELPELWNVIKGDMSLVGPRPLLMEYLTLYNEEQFHRHYVRPGITGWAQINGRNAVEWEERFKLDIWYVNHQSIWLDIKILCLTVKKVFSRDGISEDGGATMTKFTGNKQ